MTEAPATFDAIMAPLGAAAFLGEYLGKRPLHLEGTPRKWAGMMDWGVLNRLLGMSTIWSHGSLILVLDKEPIAYADYTQPAPGRDGGQVLRPDPVKVQAWLKRGATLVLNDIDQLTPELAAFCKAMEATLGAKLQANLYLSSKRKQGFKAHFDTHDVFAVHVMGEKTWTVFEGRAEAPIAHPAFKGLSQEHHEQAKGAVWREVPLKAGDLLYLPRGQYHYALAEEGPCAHIAFGATYPIGLDVMSYLFERIVHEPLARANLPGDPTALKARLRHLGERVAALLGDDRTAADIGAFQAGYHYPRDTYDLPGLIEAAEDRYRLKAGEFRLVEQGGKLGLANQATRQAVEVPGALKAPIAWVLERKRFGRRELKAAFPIEDRRVDQLLLDLGRMGVIEAEAA